MSSGPDPKIVTAAPPVHAAASADLITTASEIARNEQFTGVGRAPPLIGLDVAGNHVQMTQLPGEPPGVIITAAQ